MCFRSHFLKGGTKTRSKEWTSDNVNFDLEIFNCLALATYNMETPCSLKI